MQRPLKTIAIRSGDVYIPRGVSVPALDKDTLWEFQPKKIGIMKMYFRFCFVTMDIMFFKTLYIYFSLMVYFTNIFACFSRRG